MSRSFSWGIIAPATALGNIAPGTLLFALVAAAAASAPIPPDPYTPGRAVVAEIDRIVTPKGVDETFVATLGGAREVVNVRGADRGNPILLFVHGWPGAVEMPIAWAFQRPWEDYFTVVQWDQRGAGRSFPLNDPKKLAPTMNLARYRGDAIELIGLLCKRYGKRKVFLMGHSKVLGGGACGRPAPTVPAALRARRSRSQGVARLFQSA